MTVTIKPVTAAIPTCKVYRLAAPLPLPPTIVASTKLATIAGNTPRTIGRCLATQPAKR